MIIEVFTKNFSLAATLKAATGPVPRVGEVIETAQDVGYLQGNTSLLVHEVVYALNDNMLTPIVRCHAASPIDHRLLILQEQGWIQRGE